MAVIETAELIPTGMWTADPSHSHVEFAVKPHEDRDREGPRRRHQR